jgi:hypothetical protein
MLQLLCKLLNNVSFVKNCKLLNSHMKFGKKQFDKVTIDQM